MTIHKSVLTLIFLFCLPFLSTSFEIIAPEAAVAELNGFKFIPIIALAGLSAKIPREGIKREIWIASFAEGGDAANACNLEDFVKYANGRAQGKVVMVQRGGCLFYDKGVSVVAAGGKAMLVYHNLGTNQAESLMMLGDGRKLDIVAEGFSQMEGNLLIDLTNKYGPLTVNIYQNPTSQEQIEGLKEFYFALNGHSWTTGGTRFLEWEGNSDPCQDIWNGVSCSFDGNVTVLSLQSCGLKGTIPDSFYTKLNHLILIDFGNNELSGTLPDAILAMDDLIQIAIPDNNFTGTLPMLSSMLSLGVLDVSDNNFHGNLDADPYLFEFIWLDEINFSNNNFSGTIPTVTNLGVCRFLDISGNMITGDLNDVQMTSWFEDQNKTFIEYIDFGGNLFYGEIPSYFGNFTALTVLDLGSNKLSGTLPSSFKNLSNLRLLDISNNSFSGEVFSNNLPPNITAFRAAYNKFNAIPTSFGQRITLQELDLSRNLIESTYTSLLASLPIPVDAAAAAINCLRYIDLSHNKIYAAENFFQLVMFQWPYLVSFKMNDNNIGKPLMYIGAGNQYLRTVDLSNNPINGSIPAEVNTFGAEFILTGTRLRYDPNDGSLPSTFYPDYTATTYYPRLNMSCPQIRMYPSGAPVTLQPEYHAYELCQCEPNFRRKSKPDGSVEQGLLTGQPQFLCFECPEVGMTCQGRANDTKFIIHKNYYPTPNEFDPVLLLECPACRGTNIETGDFECEENHDGRLCSKCINDTFARGNNCDKCAPVGSTVIIVSIVILIGLVIGFTMFTIFRRELCANCFSPNVGGDSFFGTPTKSPVKRAESSPSLTKSYSSPSLTSSQTSNAGLTGKAKVRPVKESSVAALLIAINFYQTVSALSQYYELPVSVNQLLSAVKVVTSVTGSGLGLECLHERLREYKDFYAAIMLEPVLCIAGVLLVYALGKLYCLIVRRVPLIFHEWEITCTKMMLFVINLLFFPITSTAINAFRCSEDPYTHESYNSQYPYQKCDDIPLANRVVALLFFSIGVLVLFSSLIFIYVKKTNRGEDPPGSVPYVIEKSFGFFFLHFRERYYWFAIVILLRRFIISLITSLVKVNSVLGFGLNNLVLASSAFVVLVKKPFRTHVDNLLETTTILCCLFIYGAAVLMSYPDFSYGAVAIEVFYFLVNAFVLIWCAVEFIRTNLPVVFNLWKKHTGKEREDPASGAEGTEL